MPPRAEPPPASGGDAAPRILLIEDDADDAALTRELLGDIFGAALALEWVRSWDAGLAAVGETRHDIYLVDYRLGDRNGLQLVRAAIDGLAGAGAHVREVEWPEVSLYAAAVGVITLAEAAAYHEQYLPARRVEYSDEVARKLEAGAQIRATQYVDAMRVMQQARRGEADRVLDGVDVLMTPQVQEVAPPIADVLMDQHVGRRVVFTGPIDLTGQPAMSVPCGLSSDGLPVGLQIIGRRWDEAAVVRAGRAYEMVRGPFPAPPIS